MVEDRTATRTTRLQRRNVIRRLAAIGTVGVLATALGPTELAAAAPPFVPGTATATSQAVQVAPRTGGLAATITIGTSIADYRGSLAQASSQTLDLGLIGTDLTVQCDSTPPLVRPDQLPQPLIAESDHGASKTSQDTAGGAKSGVLAAAGRESVLATTKPQSDASFDGAQLVVPGVVTVSGLHTHSHSRLVKGTARIAEADTKIGSVQLLGGKVSLSGLQWSAQQRTGSHAGSHSSFSIQSARVAGHQLPVTAASIDSSVHTINKTLKPTGLHLRLPSDSSQGGKLSISPLSIGIDNSKLGNDTINPVLTAIQPVSNQLTDLLIGINCKLGNFLTLADLALSAVDGTGGVDVDLGGVTAATDDKSYGDPFGHPKPSGRTPEGGRRGTPGHAGATTRTITTPGTSSGSGASSPTAATAPVSQVAGTTTESASCATTSPAGRPSCSRGAGLTVALAALGLLVLFAATDCFVLRARRKAAEQA